MIIKDLKMNEYKTDLWKRIVETASRYKSHVEIFDSLQESIKQGSKISKVDIASIIHLYKEMSEAIILVKIYRDNFSDSDPESIRILQNIEKSSYDFERAILDFFSQNEQ